MNEFEANIGAGQVYSQSDMIPTDALGNPISPEQIEQQQKQRIQAAEKEVEKQEAIAKAQQLKKFIIDTKYFVIIDYF